MEMALRIQKCVTFSLMLVSFASLISLISGYNVPGHHVINVTVNGSDDFEHCYSRGSCSIDAAFHAVMRKKEFKSSTMINIAPGIYRINTTFSFRASDLTITAMAGDSTGPISVHIQCEGNSSSLSFYKCSNVVIRGISLVSCGALYNSSSYHNPLFYSAIFVKDSADFLLSNVAIRGSLGVGMTMYDTAGNVTIYNAVFRNNGPHTSSCQDIVANNRSHEGKKIANAGGGMYVEFTYNGSESRHNIGAYYRILQSKFSGNKAPFSGLMETSFKRLGGAKHFGFSRGGGLSLYFRGSTENNTFRIDSCVFQDNFAVWGGGYFIQFLDNVQENSVTISNTNVSGNSACFGGGAFQLSVILNVLQPGKLVSNKLQSEHCLFFNNTAMSGGGGTVFGRTSLAHTENSYFFTNCNWNRNTAVVGSAITLKLWDYDQGLFGPSSPFKVKMTNCNIERNTMRKTASQDLGVGAVYDFLVPLFLKNVNFTENTNTSLVLDTSSVTIIGNVTFSRNTGFKGGAVAMYGEASFNLTKGSTLTFIGNIAKDKGGAVFVKNPGPEFIPNVTNNYLHTRDCFFKYENKDANPNDWQAQVVFIENYAPHASGYSVFASSLQNCVYPEDIDTRSVLQWSCFYYYNGNASNSTLKHNFGITTDAVRIYSEKSDWEVSADEVFSPQVTLFDEKNNSVYGIVHIGINNGQMSSVTLGTPSPLFLVKDNITFLDLKGNTGNNFSVQIRTVDGQLALAKLNNVTLKRCNPGFVQQGKECVCLSVQDYPGISRCAEDKRFVYLERGYWAGEIKTKNGDFKFVTAQCPSGYCNCERPSEKSLKADECFYNATTICKGNRMGVLCGSCREGYSVLVGQEDCSSKCGNSDLWKLALLLICLTILVFFIFRINLDIFTCYMNAWLYFYQVVNLVISAREEVSLDPFITFIIGLANITISGFGSCFWKGMDNLSKLAFSYLLPAYVFIVIFIIGLISRWFPNTFFARNSTFRACCTLFVLCYSTLTSVTMEILRPSKIGNMIVVFHQGTVEYFSSYHCCFAVPAIFVLLLVVVPFPFILMFTPFFIRRVKCVTYLTPLFNTFQACFKDDLRWFAAFYFFSRLFLLVFGTFIPYGESKAAILQCACVVILTVHVYLCPYLPMYDWINKLDSVLLVTLAIISIIAGQMTKYISINAKNNMKVIVNILAYIPLVYAVSLGLYLMYAYAWVKKKCSSKTEVSEGNFQDFSNLNDTNDTSDTNDTNSVEVA